ncbi:unnamed protein product [Sphagnum jensenii]|uniref:Uncharacterized protein n=1 Tax=Sphagnum jensenii TaxID=128206 RepID=A0ABP0VHE6_9BRYO
MQDANGQTTRGLGKTRAMTLDFDGLPSILEFEITNLSVVEVLLGLDWFDQTGVPLDPKNRTYSLPERNLDDFEDNMEVNEHLSS